MLIDAGYDKGSLYALCCEREIALWIGDMCADEEYVGKEFHGQGVDGRGVAEHGEGRESQWNG